MCSKINRNSIITPFNQNAGRQSHQIKQPLYSENVQRQSVVDGCRSRKGRNKSKSESISDLVNRTTERETATVVALCEGRGRARGEVGIAAVDINQPHLILCQLSDNFWYTGTLIKLQMFGPITILVPNTFCGRTKIRLLEIIEINYSDVTILSIGRKHFNNVDGLAMMQLLCSAECEAIQQAIANKYFTLAAAAGLLKYLENNANLTFVPRSLKIEYQSRYGVMTIDIETSHRLELLYPLCNTREKRASLFGALDNCATLIGKRVLRTRILEPSADLTTIMNTQDAIAELLQNESMLFGLEKELKKFHFVDKLMKLAIAVPKCDGTKGDEKIINLVLMLKTNLKSTVNLLTMLANVETKNLVEILDGMNDPCYPYILQQIDFVVDTSAEHSRGVGQLMQRINTIRSGVNEMLDLIRSIYVELLEKMNVYIDGLSTEHNLQFRLNYSVQLEFHIQLNVPKKSPDIAIPTVMILLQKRRNVVYLMTTELANLNIRAKRAVEEIYKLTRETLDDLLGKIRAKIDAIYNLIGFISELDVLQSLARVCTFDCSYSCRPQFGNELRVIDGVHPLLEWSRDRVQPVPNNIIGTPEYNFFIITGPNMGGKSIYIKTIAILQIMAQLGCYVPARSADFRICDKLFSRIGFEDNMEQKASSFMVEMNEMEYIFKNVTPNSIVIIDELCRSTNTRDGPLLAWTLAEKLTKLKGPINDGHYFTNNTAENNRFEKTADSSAVLSNVKLNEITSPFIYLTTHFRELTKLADHYFNVVNLHLLADGKYDENGKLQLTYLHKVQAGITPTQSYGLALARFTRFPASVMPRAEQLLETFESNVKCPTPNLPEPLSQNRNSNTAMARDFLELQRHLYDLYANIVALSRSHPANADNGHDNECLFKQKIMNLIEDFIAVQTDEMLDAIRGDAFGADLKKSDVPQVTSNEHLSTEKWSDEMDDDDEAEFADLSQLSLNSIVQKFSRPNVVESVPQPSVSPDLFLSQSPSAELSQMSNLSSRQSCVPASGARSKSPKLSRITQTQSSYSNLFDQTPVNVTGSHHQSSYEDDDDDDEDREDMEPFVFG